MSESLPDYMEIDVTEEHIKNGTPNSASYCPIALAIKEKLINDGVVSLIVHHLGTSIETVEGVRFFDMDNEARKFIGNFDNGKMVDPFTLKLSRRRI